MAGLIMTEEGIRRPADRKLLPEEKKETLIRAKSRLLKLQKSTGEKMSVALCAGCLQTELINPVSPLQLCDRCASSEPDDARRRNEDNLIVLALILIAAAAILFGITTALERKSQPPAESGKSVFK